MKPISILFLLLTSWPAFLQAQEEPWFRVSGNFGASTEFYNFNSTDSTLLPRRPDFNYRVSFSPTFHFGKHISLPLNLLATRRFSQATLPLPTHENPIRNLTNPNNAIGISPTFGWATFHLGSHTANFSELSTGNQPLFGAGVDLRPGYWRIAYSQGVLNWALQPDTTVNTKGVYTRKFQAMKLGWQADDTFFFINTTKISDDANSISETNLKPQEGVLFTVEIGFEFSDHITGKVEAGASAFTRNLNDEPVDRSNIDWVSESIFVVNQSTRLDYASIYSLSIDYPTWGLTLKQKKLGAGYEPLGYGFVETDVLDRTVSPRLQLFKNKFILNATGGIRTDNLSGTKLATTERIIVSGNVMAMFSKSFSVSGTYSNYGSRNNVQNDTFRLEFVSKNLTLTPTYRFEYNGIKHSISATYAQSDFNDKNLFSGELASNKTETYGTNYSLRAGKFSLLASGTMMSNQRSTGKFDITTFTLRPGYEPIKRKLDLSLGLVYAIIAQEGFTDSKRFIVRPKLRWRPSPKLTFQLTGNLHTYRYGTIRNNAMFDESYLQTSIQHQF